MSRDPVLGRHESDVVQGGIFRSWAFDRGAAVALWRIAGGRVRIAPFAPLSKRAERALLAEADEVLAYLGMPAKEPVLEPAP